MEGMLHVSNFPIEEKEELKQLIRDNVIDVFINSPYEEPEDYPTNHMIGIYAPTYYDLEEFWMFYDKKNCNYPGGEICEENSNCSI